jgi:hypothetical protein
MAAMMLAVAIAASVCHFASVGINLRRRGFTPAEALGAIGTALTIGLATGVVAMRVVKIID